MEWTREEADALNNLIEGFGRIRKLSEESKDRLFDYCVAFHKKAFDIEEREEPKGIIV